LYEIHTLIEIYVKMSKLLLMQTLFTVSIALFSSTASFHRFRNRTRGDARGLEHQKYTLFRNNSLPEIGKEKQSSGAITNANNSNPRKILSNNTRKHGNSDNSTDDISNRGCNGDKSSAICHTYIHNMYQFYSTIGGFVMLAIVFTGITFLIVTHFHGRHIVKTNQHVVGTIAKWDAIQHRKQQSRERNGNWI